MDCQEKTCDAKVAFESRCRITDERLLNLESANDSAVTLLKEVHARLATLEHKTKLHGCRTSNFPFEPGCTFFMGDYPRRDGSLDSLADGKVSYAHQDRALRVCRNDTGRTLLKGEAFDDGRVDPQLRTEGVSPKDYFYLEI